MKTRTLKVTTARINPGIAIKPRRRSSLSRKLILGTHGRVCAACFNWPAETELIIFQRVYPEAGAARRGISPAFLRFRERSGVFVASRVNFFYVAQNTTERRLGALRQPRGDSPSAPAPQFIRVRVDTKVA